MGPDPAPKLHTRLPKSQLPKDRGTRGGGSVTSSVLTNFIGNSCSLGQSSDFVVEKNSPREVEKSKRSSRLNVLHKLRSAIQLLGVLLLLLLPC